MTAECNGPVGFDTPTDNLHLSLEPANAMQPQIDREQLVTVRPHITLQRLLTFSRARLQIARVANLRHAVREHS